MLPVFISDPELRAKAAETFNSEEFQDNIENYFVENIKVRLKGGKFKLSVFLKVGKVNCQCF